MYSLRDHYTSRLRLPAIVLISIVGTIGTIVTLVSFDLLTTTFVLLLITATLFFIVVLTSPYYSMVVLILFITTLHGLDVVSKYRMYLLIFPVNVFDVALLFLVGAAVARSRRHKSARLALVGFNGPVFAWLPFCLFFTLWGFINSNPVYHIFRADRSPVFLVLTYFCTKMLIEELPQVETLLKVFVIGVFIGTLYSVHYFVTISIGRYLSTLNVGSLRHLGIPILFQVTATFVLLFALVHHPSLFGKKKAIALVSMNLFGILISFTRSTWVATVLSIVILFLLARSPGRFVVMRWLLLALVVLAIGILAVQLVLPQELDLLDVAYGRLMTLNIDKGMRRGGAYSGRYIGVRTEWAAWRDGNLLVGRGFGFWDWDPYRPELIGGGGGIRHNSYSYSLANSGLIGLAFIIWFLLCLLRKSLAIYRLNHSGISNLLSISLVSYIVLISIAASTGGALSSDPAMIFLGVLAGLMDAFGGTGHDTTADPGASSAQLARCARGTDSITTPP